MKPGLKRLWLTPLALLQSQGFVDNYLVTRAARSGIYSAKAGAAASKIRHCSIVRPKNVQMKPEPAGDACRNAQKILFAFSKF